MADRKVNDEDSYAERKRQVIDELMKRFPNYPLHQGLVVFTRPDAESRSRRQHFESLELKKLEAIFLRAQYGHQRAMASGWGGGVGIWDQYGREIGEKSG